MMNETEIYKVHSEEWARKIRAHTNTKMNILNKSIISRRTMADIRKRKIITILISIKIDKKAGADLHPMKNRLISTGTITTKGQTNQVKRYQSK